MLMLKHILLGPFMKTSKKLTIGLLVLNSATYSQTNIEEFIKQREEDFSQYKASVTKQYEQYELQEKQAFEKYKQEIEEKWLEFKESGKKEYVDKDYLPIHPEGWQVHPLPLLTCEGNGRGGGDYTRNNRYIGSWARNQISIEKQKPEDFKEIIPLFMME